MKSFVYSFVIWMQVILYSSLAIADASESVESSSEVVGQQILTAQQSNNESVNTADPVNVSAEGKVLAEAKVPAEVKAGSKLSNSNTLSRSASPVSELPTVILTLFLLISGIFILAWLARRYGSFGLTKGNRISVKSTIPVGSRERVSLIEVDGKKILIGITSHQVNLIHAFDGLEDQENISNQVESIDQGRINSPFAEKFKAAILKNNGVTGENVFTNIEKRAE